MTINDQSWFWIPDWQAKEAEAIEDLRLGRYKTFETLDEMIAALETATDKEENQILVASPLLAAAIAELDAGGGQRFNSVAELFASWDAEEDSEV